MTTLEVSHACFNLPGRTVHTKDTDAGKIIVTKLAPHALVKARDTVVGISRTLAIGDAIEKVAVVSALLPHALHLGTTGLEVAKILLAQARLLIYLDIIALKGRGLWAV